MQRFRKLHNALVTAKSALKVTAPIQPGFLKTRHKQQTIRRQEMEKVYYENKLLLRKMDDIQRRPKTKAGNFRGPRKAFQVATGSYPVNASSLNTKHKRNEQRKVDQENLVRLGKSGLAEAHQLCEAAL